MHAYTEVFILYFSDFYYSWSPKSADLIPWILLKCWMIIYSSEKKNISFYWFYTCHYFYDLILSHVPFLSKRKNEHKLLLHCFGFISLYTSIITLLPIFFNLREPLFYQHKHNQSNHYSQLFGDSSLSRSACLISPKS